MGAEENIPGLPVQFLHVGRQGAGRRFLQQHGQHGKQLPGGNQILPLGIGSEAVSTIGRLRSPVDKHA